MKIIKILYLAGLISSLCTTVFLQDRSFTVVVKRQQSGKTEEIKLYDGSYALVVGESDYTGGWDDLPGVKTDVAEVRRVLEKGGFVVESEMDLTSDALNARIGRFISDYGYGQDNRLLIYFAGHGHTQRALDGRDLGYIVPSDSPLPAKDPIGFRRKAISEDTVRNYARMIEAKHAIFIFDSCFSGKLVSRGDIKVPPVIMEDVAYPVRQFITAGAADQTVPDNSVFRRAFVRGLEGEADRNADKFVTGTELAEYLKEKVTNATDRSETPQYGKIHDIDLDRGDFVFTISSASASVRVPPTNTTSTTEVDVAVEGEVIDQQTGDAIEGAIIGVLPPNSSQQNVNPKDLLYKERSDANGDFHLSGSIKPGKYTVQVAHADYKSFFITIQIPASRKKLLVGLLKSSEAESVTVSKPKFIAARIVKVLADETANGWTNSGLVVTKGQIINFSAKGTISLGKGKYSEPDGNESVKDDDKLLKTWATGGLIAVIDNNNDEFIFIGSNQSIIAQRNGTLFLGINEGHLKDNSGAYEVNVEVFEGNTQASKPASHSNPGISVKVLANNTANGWTNTGLVVTKGQRLLITSSGRINLGGERYSSSSGLTALEDKDKLLPNEATGALIAVIGSDNNDFILIGSTKEIVATRDGILFLGVNEGNLDDNSGAFDAKIEILN